jgi:hypothetical protein
MSEEMRSSVDDGGDHMSKSLRFRSITNASRDYENTSARPNKAKAAFMGQSKQELLGERREEV